MNIRKEITGTMRKCDRWNVEPLNVYGNPNYCRRIKMESDSVGVELKRKQRGGIIGEFIRGIKWDKVTGKLNFDIIRIKETVVLMLVEGRVCKATLPECEETKVVTHHRKVERVK